MAAVMSETDELRDAGEIRAGIEKARQEIELSVTDLRNEVRRTLDVSRWVREHPAAFLGGAFAPSTGSVAGSPRRPTQSPSTTGLGAAP